MTTRPVYWAEERARLANGGDGGIINRGRVDVNFCLAGAGLRGKLASSSPQRSLFERPPILITSMK